MSLVRVASIAQPVALAVRSGDPAMYVALKTGEIMAIRDGRLDRNPVLDLSAAVSLGGEQGLLGIAFAPDGRHLFVNFTDVVGNTRVLSYAMRGDEVDPSSRRLMLAVEQPYSNHNGGNLVFGPDGDLYIGLGDGGSGGDPHGNGQSLETLLGKMLRIEPTPDAAEPYAVPSDNPFVDRDNARPEIWAYGLRNPWRYSFDRATGDLWIGDVGQDAWEEVDRLPAGDGAGANLGWNVLEGSHPYAGDALPGAVLPVYEYAHADGGCVVTGGYVYRGTAIEDLIGSYVFADFCLGELLALPAGATRPVDLGAHVSDVSSFGEDDDGELYVLSLSDGVFRLEPA